MNGKTFEFCCQAIKKTDQSILKELATSNLCDTYKCTAVRRLTNQELLAEIAMNEDSCSDDAIRSITDQSKLEEIAKNLKSNKLRDITVYRLKNRHMLIDFMENDESIDVRNTAKKILMAQDRFAGKFSIDDAVKTITDSNIDFIIDCLANPINVPLTRRIMESLDEMLLNEIRLQIPGVIFDKSASIQQSRQICEEFITGLQEKRMRKIKVYGLQEVHLRHNDFIWITEGTCKNTCSVCGIGKYDHDYVVTASQGYDDSDDARRFFTDYTCMKCGEYVHIGNSGGHKNEGYCI